MKYEVGGMKDDALLPYLGLTKMAVRRQLLFSYFSLHTSVNLLVSQGEDEIFLRGCNGNYSIFRDISAVNSVIGKNQN